MQAKGYHVRIAKKPSEVAMHCNVIVTTTASTQPLLAKNDIQPGTHITAVGADSPGKIELDPKLVASCHTIIADSVSQCLDHGELASTYQQKHIQRDQVIEHGHLLESRHRIKTSSNGISLCDLTGLAIQDIQIVKSILQENADDGASSTNHYRKQPGC